MPHRPPAVSGHAGTEPAAAGVRMRTCIATRSRHPDIELLRVVIDPADPHRRRVRADPARHLPGRGAWLRPDIAAVDLAQQRRAFSRALRIHGPVDTTALREYLTGLASYKEQRKTEH